MAVHGADPLDTNDAVTFLDSAHRQCLYIFCIGNKYTFHSLLPDLHSLMAASLLRTRGFLSLTGPLVDALAQNSCDSSGELLHGIKTVDEFHITVLTKAELQSSPENSREGNLPLLDTSRIYSTGTRSFEAYVQ